MITSFESPVTLAAETQATEHSRRGFTLTEIAIVLGIIGLILGAIWVAAAAVYSNQRVGRATTELLQITQAIRSLYATGTIIDTLPAGTVETASMCSAGIFPTDTACTTVAPGTAQGRWTGSTISVWNSTDGVTAGSAFQVQFGNIPSAACITMGTNSAGTGRDSGLISVDAKAPTVGVVAAYIAPGGTGAVPAFFTVPVTATGATVSSAAAKCAPAAAAGANADLAFTFKLRG